MNNAARPRQANINKHYKYLKKQSKRLSEIKYDL